MNILYAMTFVTLVHFSNAYLHFDQSKLEDTMKNPLSNNYTEKNFTTKIDNFSPQDNRTFNLKYYESNQYWKNESGPIFLQICGEQQVCMPYTNEFAPIKLAIELNAKIIALEHRYYGKSQPFTNEQGGWSTDNLKYLNSSQAIEDIHSFMVNLRSMYGQDRQIVIHGCSYPGALAAWYQHLYNDATAVWSSSGVINAFADFIQYDQVVVESVNKSKGCLEKLKNNTETINQIISQMNNTEREKFFQGTNEWSQGVQNFMFLGQHYKIAEQVQYGNRSNYCNKSAKFYKHISLNQDYIQLYNDIFGENATETAVKKMINDERKLKDTNISSQNIDRTWFYQVCTEFGWFQTPTNPQFSLVPDLLHYKTWIDSCTAFFSTNDSYPQTKYVNKRFQSFNNTGSNIYFFTQSEDPWKYVCMWNKDFISGTQKQSYVDCDDCAHCQEIFPEKTNDSQSLKDARANATKTIKQWLSHDAHIKAAQIVFQSEILIYQD